MVAVGVGGGSDGAVVPEEPLHPEMQSAANGKATQAKAVRTCPL